MRLNSHPSGRHFLQIPGPTNVPDRIQRAMDHPTIDHRGPEFNALAKKVLRSVRQVFQTKQPVIVYPASGTGAWEAALVNTLSSGDLVLMWETGHFACTRLARKRSACRRAFSVLKLWVRIGLPATALIRSWMARLAL